MADKTCDGNICGEDPCECEPCPNCDEIDTSFVMDCHKCHQPMCECCGHMNVHFGCEAGVLYIGPRGKLEGKRPKRAKKARVTA